MTTTSHQITFKRECDRTEEVSWTKDGFEFQSTLEIDPLSPPQKITPCPDTILRYTSNIEGGIDVFAKYGTASILDIFNDVFEDKIALDGNGEATIPYSYQQIKVIGWDPLRFSGNECGDIDNSTGSISIIEGKIKGPGPGIVTLRISVKVYRISVTLKWPYRWDDTLGNPEEFVIVCQDKYKTGISFSYEYCGVRSIVEECCKTLYRLPVRVGAPDSMGSNSSATVFARSGCAPYSWGVSGATFSGGEDGDNMRTIKTTDACSDVVVTCADVCGGVDSATIEINECCPGFIIAILEGSIVDLAGMKSGETATFLLGTSDEGTRVVWVEGSDKVTVRLTPTAGNNTTLYVTVKNDACDGPFLFGIIDECNPDYIFYFSGSIDSGIICCPPEEPTEWDYENSSDTITQNGSAYVCVKGSLIDSSEFVWTVSGQGFTFANGQTTITGGYGQIIYAGPSSCGGADITVVDICDEEVSGSLRNIDSGYWKALPMPDGYKTLIVYSYPTPPGGWQASQTIQNGGYRVFTSQAIEGFRLTCAECIEIFEPNYITNLSKLEGFLDWQIVQHIDIYSDLDQSCWEQADPCYGGTDGTGPCYDGWVVFGAINYGEWEWSCEE